MSEYIVETIYKSDKRAQVQVDTLLAAEGIARDKNLDYTAGIFDEARTLLATGSCFDNTLRCLAVDGRLRGEGLLALLVTHLTQVQYERGNTHLFLYTKCDAAKYFGDLGFCEIARVEDRLVFMENRRDAFARYLDTLRPLRQAGQNAAIVMNANPFTLGHQYLVKKAAAENDHVYLFVLSQDASLVPFKDRIEMVRRGSAHLPNVHVIPSGAYMISNATFPSYFLKDDDLVTRSHAQLDAKLFIPIAQALGITRRYVGDEPFSHTTCLYNEALHAVLPAAGIACVLLPRFEKNGGAISASAVRTLIHDKGVDAIAALVPATTYDYLSSPDGASALQAIAQSSDLVHH